MVRRWILVQDKDLTPHPDHAVVSERAYVAPWADLGAGCVVHPFAYVGRLPSQSPALARKPVQHRKTVIGAHTEIGPHAVIYGGVEIGEDCLIGDYASVREDTSIGHHCIIGRLVSVNYEVKIGNHVRIMDTSHVTGRTVIGDHTVLGVGVVTSNDRRLDPRSYHYHSDQVRGPTIGAGVLVGSGANLLGGVHIGDDAIVGAHALVTHDVPAFTTIYGVHAQVREPKPGDGR